MPSTPVFPLINGGLKWIFRPAGASRCTDNVKLGTGKRTGRFKKCEITASKRQNLQYLENFTKYLQRQTCKMLYDQLNAAISSDLK